VISIAVEKAFSTEIFPGFPFANRTWRGVAFERDSYDNTRVPEDWFRSALGAFGPGTISVRGWGGAFERRPAHTAMVPFDWPAYREFMLAPENWSVEYKMLGSTQDWGVWADAEITVWGGSPELMERAFSALGGTECVLARVKREFGVVDGGRYAELRAYLETLVYGSRATRPDPESL
jgi:hypothetical protein